MKIDPNSWWRRWSFADRFRGAQLLADGVAVWTLAAIRLEFEGRGLEGLDPAAMLAVTTAVINFVFLAYTPGLRPRWWPGWAGMVAANLIAALAFPSIAGALDYQVKASSVWFILCWFVPVQAALHLLGRRFRTSYSAEPLRVALIVATGVGAGFPMLSYGSVGTGDAYWYGTMVADFVTQWRAGVFPVLIGQSDFAFNGAVSPLRIAPYLQHATGLLDLLTAHSLTFFALLNLTLVLSSIGGGLAAYRALLGIDNRIRWTAMLLAVLYLASPAALALTYSGDLYMSVCTLPWLPLALLGVRRVNTGRHREGALLLAVSLAAMWSAHPPIAFWASVTSGLGLLPCLCSPAIRDRAVWRSAALGLAAFAALALFVFVSAGSLGLPTAEVDRGLITKGVMETSPEIFLPIGEASNPVTDHQLGWTLWAVLLAGCAALPWQRGRRIWGLFLAALILLGLSLPFAPLLNLLWGLVPQAVCNLTFFWPMQRFAIVLTALAIVLGHHAASRIAGWNKWAHAAAFIGLLFGLDWTTAQATEFVGHGFANARAGAGETHSHDPGNRILTRYAFNPFPVYTGYFSHGYIDPLWENRLLSRGNLAEVTSNYAAAIGPASVVRAEGEINARQAGEGPLYYALLDRLELQPGRSYALEFSFNRPELNGTMVGNSETLTRVYLLPDSGTGTPRPKGLESGFGSIPSGKKAMSLRHDSLQAEHFSVQFVAREVIAADISKYGRYTLREYDRAQLPIAVESWAPYRAQVNSPADAWLETPRLYLAGYRAFVNGKPASVRSSPAGQVMLPVDAGISQVELTYPGPIALRIAYWVSFLSWTALGAWLLLGAIRWIRAEPPATVPAGAR